MQLIEAVLRRHRFNSYSYFVSKHQLRHIVLPIAEHISQRAYRFIKKIFEVDSISKMQELSWAYQIPNATQSPMCSRVMTERTDISSFRCYDCMESSSSCICELCFKDGNHIGHNYVQYTAVNGCCDCGNAQAWNEKGFCKTHTAINNLQIELSTSVKAMYIDQGTLLIYIYFYLCFVEKDKSQENIEAIETYGRYIFNYFKTISQKSYDMKLLGCALLNSKLPNIYPKLMKQDLTLLQIFFMVPIQKAKGYEQLIHFFFELFPVEEHRRTILFQYFKKMKQIGQNMIKQYPLAGLNFQYLSCVKLIITMINKGELQPLQIFAAKPYIQSKKNIDYIARIYKKYYEDLDYINNMKSAKEYQKLHLMKTNVAEFASYRQYTTIPMSIENKHHINQFNIDEMFIKIFAKFVRNLKQQKNVLIKAIQDLFHYIVNAKENYSSLAQERAFAMLIFTYFQGDITHLANQYHRNQFIIDLYCTQQQLAIHLKPLIKNSLKTKININQLTPCPKGMYQSYFLRINCQKNVEEFLDCIFHKILILLSHQICPYDKVIEELFVQLNAQEGQRNQNTGKIQKILVILQLLNSVSRIEIDELVVGGLVRIVNKPKLFQFYARIISTFKKLSIKQIKILCLQLMNSEQLFEQFIMNYTTSQRGKLKLKQILKPLEYFDYNGVFNKFSFHMPQNDIAYLTGQEQTENIFGKINVFNSQTIRIVVDILEHTTIDLSEKLDKRTQHYFNAAAIELLKMQFNSKIEKPRLFLQMLLNESMRVFLYKNVVEQVTIISKKEQDLHRDLEKIKVQQAEQFRLKRQKIMNKRKMKQQIMKKNQQQILYKFKHLQEMKTQGIDKPMCIYCHGQKQNQMLSLISYIGITNLIEKTLLKQNTFHYFFTTCGHYIHSNCYIEANTKDNNKHCFLCKQQFNILIPDFITFQQQKTKYKADEFFVNIISALVNEYEFVNGKIGKYQTLVFENNEYLLVESFAKQLVYKGLNSYGYFKKNLYFLYLQIYEIIKLVDKEKLTKYVQARSQSEKQPNKIEILVKYVMMKLIDMVPSQEQSTLNINSQQIQQINKIVDVIINKKVETEIIELKYINPDSIFIKIPQTLKELHMYMGKCKLCPNVTNNIFLCLNCGWSGCLKCSLQIFKHVTAQHLQGAAIMGCSTGSVKYVKQTLIFEGASIYQNYLGLPFTDADSFNEFTRAEKYNLNREKQRQVKMMMLRYQINQKIKLNANYK